VVDSSVCDPLRLAPPCVNILGPSPRGLGPNGTPIVLGEGSTSGSLVALPKFGIREYAFTVSRIPRPEEKMKPFVFLLIVFTAGFVGAQKTNSCHCACVNGEVKALCSSSTDVPPVCAPRVCPIVTPSVKPIAPPRVPPVGTSTCKMKQVYNETTKKYEWKSVCK
jgi:hypothetical protein